MVSVAFVKAKDDMPLELTKDKNYRVCGVYFNQYEVVNDLGFKEYYNKERFYECILK